MENWTYEWLVVGAVVIAAIAFYVHRDRNKGNGGGGGGKTPGGPPKQRH